jgi:carbon storage regulator CsrA
MLVLSRKEDQRVVIPGLGISIKVVRCKNSSVTLGFDAPPEIRIVRDEIGHGLSVQDPSLGKFMEDTVQAYPNEQRHEARNQFNVVAMAMQMLLEDIESGEFGNVNEIFDSVCERLKGLASAPKRTNVNYWQAFYE